MMAGFRCDLHGLLMLGQSGCGQKQQARDAGLSHIKIVRITSSSRKCDLCFWRFAPHRFGILKNPILTTDNTDNTDLHRSKKFNRTFFRFANPCHPCPSVVTFAFLCNALASLKFSGGCAVWAALLTAAPWIPILLRRLGRGIRAQLSWQ